MKYRRAENRHNRQALEYYVGQWKPELKGTLSAITHAELIKLYDEYNPVKIRETIMPLEFTRMLLREIADVADLAWKEGPGSMEQRVLLIEIHDLVEVLMDPDTLEKTRNFTTNGTLYECPPIEF